jgi:hypothetical protein
MKTLATIGAIYLTIAYGIPTLFGVFHAASHLIGGGA